MPFNIPDSAKKRIVIIGAGFAGFTLANKLKGKGFQIVLIDKNNYHQFQPLFYQVAMSGLEPSSICFPLRKNFQNEPDFYVRVAEVIRILPDTQKLESSIGIMRYDILVIANGAKTNYYNNPNFEKYSIPLKSVSEALYLRNSILDDLEQAVMSPDSIQQDKYLDIVIVGGGATGVELAGALAEMKNYILPKDYPDLDHQKMEIHLIQGAGKLLAGMSEKASVKAEKNLRDMGIQLHLNAYVKDMKQDEVELQNGLRIQASKIIWAAGVSGAQIPGLPESVFGQGGRIKVNQALEIEGMQNMFAIGDISIVQNDPKFPKGHPQVSPVAIQQAKRLAANLSLMQQQKPIKPFLYTDKGSLATIGRNKAVADFPGKIFLSGFVAWVVWLFIHIFFLIGSRNKIIVFINWIWSYVFYDQALRLIIKPKIKTSHPEKE